MDKVLSDDGDHPETGIVLLVGGLQMRERYDTVTEWEERKKGRKSTISKECVKRSL